MTPTISPIIIFTNIENGLKAKKKFACSIIAVLLGDIKKLVFVNNR